jgi:predicted hydrolase (HD superfamily)
MTTSATSDKRFGREQAWQLLTEWTLGESLRKHALAVEACVAAYGEQEADRLGFAGEERAAFLNLYSTTALLHDYDYERHPSREEHPFVGVRELAAFTGTDPRLAKQWWAPQVRISTKSCLRATSWQAF